MKNIITIHNCNKTYKSGVKALSNLSLAIKENDFFALLGPNGAGKTTTIGMISSLVKPSSGSIKLFDNKICHSSWQAKSQIGIMPQEVNCNIFNTTMQTLLTSAGLYGINYKEAYPLAKDLIAKLGLWDKRDTTISKLSGGQKRRVMLARAVIHNPKILLLDEPTAGIDIETREETWKFIKEIHNKGTTIILTTHYLEEAERLCNKVAIIDEGKLLRNSSMQELLGTLETEQVLLHLAAPILSKPNISDVDFTLSDPQTLEITLTKKQNIGDIIATLAAAGISVNRVQNKRNRLEELFLTLTKNKSNSAT
jgi:ABC-2 type transport system ATP-binding protein